MSDAALDGAASSAASAAAAGGLVVGFHVPFAGRAQRRPQAAAPDEINAWVVVKPDDTVVIRIARSEMGQGSLTGLAQLVAEELECNWAKVTTEYPTPGAEPRAQPRLGQLLDRRQPRHPRVAGVRAQGRRDRAHDAGAGRGQRVEGAGRPNARAANGVITHTPSGRTHHATARSPRPRRKLTPPADVRAEGPEGLEDRRQAAGAPRHRRQGDGRADLRHGPQAARHAERGDQGLPGVRRQGEERRRRGDREAPRREEGRARRRLRGRGRRRHLVAREDRARRAADRMGRRPERQGVERQRRRDAEGRARCARGRASATRVGDARRRSPAAAAQDRGGLLVPAPEPRDDGADERDGALDARALRGLDADAERRGRARRHVGGRRPAARASARSTSCYLGGGFGRRGAVHDWVRQAVAIAKADAGHAGQADLVARRGHAARPLPPGHAVQAAAPASTRTAT